MYANIKTGPALQEVSIFLHQRSKRYPVPTSALSEALGLDMKNNIFQFGDLYFKQLKGTNIWTPEGCSYTNLFFAIHENMIYKRYSNLLYIKRYIDDIIVIWVPSEDSFTDKISWTSFTKDLNDFHQLQWEVLPLSLHVTVLDINFYLTNGIITTDLHHKEMNLYQYITPHSSHPPGVISGMVLGWCHRIYTLCSSTQL